jgi:hypothetical protein
MNEATEEKPPTRGPKTFAQTLQDHHFGYTAEEATHKLKEALDASERSGKATEVIVTMKIKPVGKMGAGRYDVTIDVKNKLPAKDVEPAIMWVGPDGNLTNRDPRQMEIDGLRVVDKPRGEGVRMEEPQQQAGVRVA